MYYIYKILRPTQRERFKDEMMLKVSRSINEFTRGKVFERKKDKVRKKNFTGTIIILLCQDECEEMMGTVDRGQIMRSLIYQAKNLLS